MKGFEGSFLDRPGSAPEMASLLAGRRRFSPGPAGSCCVPDAGMEPSPYGLPWGATSTELGALLPLCLMW